jgi:hypothetical protein
MVPPLTALHFRASASGQAATRFLAAVLARTALNAGTLFQTVKTGGSYPPFCSPAADAAPIVFARFLHKQLLCLRHLKRADYREKVTKFLNRKRVAKIDRYQ